MAFKAEDVYLKGKGKWCKFVVPDTLYNKWSVNLYPDEASLKIITDLQTQGIKNRLRKDEDGYYMNFGRPCTKENKKTGQVMVFNAPKVVDKDNLPIDGSGIGNGSDLTIKLEVYEHGVPGSKSKSKAARLSSVRVDNLIPFSPEKDYTVEEQEQLKGLKEQPEPLF